MKTASRAIYSKHMILPDGMKEATLLVEGGRIAGVAGGISPWEGIELIDTGDNIVMPGIIDPHVHINEPGRTDWEGFDTATRAAIAGGITTLVDMPLNASPVSTTVKALNKKLASVAGQLHCNCGFWGGLVPDNEADIIPLIHKGVLGFKAFLTHSGIDEFPNVTEEHLHRAMPLIARYDLPLLVHCELEGPVTGKPEQAAGRFDPRSYRQYLATRPAAWEDDAIALMIRLCETYGCRTHIVHLSSANSIAPIKKAKERGLPLTAETAQHYLYFAAEDIPDGQPLFKCAPPIRERANNDRLWEALGQGVIDLVATDHSPAPPALKELESGDLTRAWGGISSVQLALPVLWTAARKRGIPVEWLEKWLCEAPALLAGESGRRGKIAPGYMADLLVWDPAQTFLVEPQRLGHKHKITPYGNEVLYGVVEQTWLGGIKVFDKGTFTGMDKGQLILRDHPKDKMHA